MQNITDLINVFDQIRTTSSLNRKKLVIKKNADDKEFESLMKFVLDSNITTGISIKKWDKVYRYKPEYTITDDSAAVVHMFELLNFLAENNTGKDEYVKKCKEFALGFQDDRIYFFLRDIITGKYKLGCDKKVVNAVIPNLIPSHEVMLGTPIEKATLKPNETIFLSRKLNGVRCSYVDGKLLSRQGKEFTGLEHIISDLRLIVGEGYFVDGELLYKNKEGLTDSAAFQKTAGLVNSKDEDKSSIKYVIFDVFPLEEFYNGRSKKPYSIRRQHLIDIAEDIDLCDTSNLEVVKMVYHGKTHSMIWSWLEKAEQLDWEGLMLKLDAPYECKRTKTLLKVKQFFDITLRIVGVEEGTGRNKGKLGALVCKYNNNTVKVGSGFSDEQRNEIWENRESYINRLIDVKYKEVTKDKNTGLESLQFPVFLGFRHDKNLADDEV